MAPDERFKKYQEAGADFLETARVRAEEFLRELSKAGESTQRQGRDALDDLRDGSRKGTEQLIASIRNEIRSQLSLLGLATKEDLAALERRLGGSAGASRTASAKKTTSKSAAARKAAPRKAATKSSGSSASGATKRASATKSPAKKASASKKATGRA